MAVIPSRVRRRPRRVSKIERRRVSTNLLVKVETWNANTKMDRWLGFCCFVILTQPGLAFGPWTKDRQLFHACASFCNSADRGCSRSSWLS
jgi:hypothetical protein